ncbi:MAG: RNA 2',3'-cyclic phosphodiesterase [Gemmatimonadetes bacterium]|nr:RNA 2',3'-cyclic phosphodiesterase [Gemmatimonadota bacterium]
MRLFVAVPLAASAEGEVAVILDRLREANWPVRWVRPEGIHVTLKFFGEVAPDRLETIAEAIDFAARGTRPIAMTLQGAGVFPSVDRPRVIHLAIDAEPSLELLQDRLERSGEQLGFPPEGRPFRPHVTLGRVREGHRLPPGWQDLVESIGPGDAFLGDRIVLYESELTKDGPRYAVRHQVVLA